MLSPATLMRALAPSRKSRRFRAPNFGPGPRKFTGDGGLSRRESRRPFAERTRVLVVQLALVWEEFFQRKHRRRVAGMRFPPSPGHVPTQRDWRKIAAIWPLKAGGPAPKGQLAVERSRIRKSLCE